MKTMVEITDRYKKKSRKLSMELDTYMAKHPETWELIPNGSILVITAKNDKRFSETALAIAKDHKKRYEPKRPLFIAQKSRRHWDFDRLELSAA